MAGVYYYQQILREIKEKGVSKAYLLFGEESLLAENVLHLIREKFLGKADPEMNYFVRYATETGIDAIIPLGSGGGLFSDKKLIVLKEVHVLKKAEMERLKKFIATLTPETCLVLMSSVASTYQTRLKLIEPVVTAVNLLPLRENELSRFVTGEFRKLGKEITPAAVETLLFMVGSQMSDLISQINHITQYFTDKETIEPEDIEQVASVYVTQDVFELCRLIGNKDFEKALFTLHNLLDSGVSPQQITAQLLRHFSLLWQIRGYHKSGIHNRDRIARELRIYSKYFPEYQAQSQKWDSLHLRRALGKLHRADRQLKDGSTSPKIMLDILSYELIN
ncbi:DNA polymerase III subunit delta [candidate division KSB1 bacterium 4484_188]|nr:MAG: DNA polymerase III subunit delta [candidate division KSB1 bacterium 4484_188]